MQTREQSALLTAEELDDSSCQPLIDDEENIIDWLHMCAAHGLIITYDYFFEEVLHHMQVTTNGKISRSDVEQWVGGFRRRWAGRLQSGPVDGPLLADERPPPSAALWYRAVCAAIAHRYPAVPLAGPDRLLCLGEMNVQLERRSAAVCRLRSQQEAAAAARDNVAFVVAVSASGEAAPPMMVTPAGGLVRGDLLSQDDCLHQTTSNGTVTPDALRRYLCDCVEPQLVARQVPRPVILYVDGRHHRASRALAEFCDAAGIILVGLPAGGAARSPVRGAVAAQLAANLARLADGVQRGRRPEPDGGCSTSARALLTGFRAATRRAAAESIRHAFQWSGLSPWSESVVSACDLGPLASELESVQLPPPPPAPLSAPAGRPLPRAGLQLEQAVRLLLDSSAEQLSPLEPADLPRPGSEGAGFLVTAHSLTERLRGKERWPADTGDGWIPGPTAVHNFLVNGAVLERVYKNRAGRFCLRESVKKELEPQLTAGDSIVEVQRMSSTWWSNATLTKRVTAITSGSDNVKVPSVALVELCPEGAELESSQEALLSETQRNPSEPGTPEEDQGPEEGAEDAPLELQHGEYRSLAVPAAGLPAGPLIRLLLDASRHGASAPDRPPPLKTPNTAYLVSNAANRERHGRGQGCRYPDGPQHWEGGASKPGQTHRYLLDGGLGARRVCGARGRYCQRVRRGGRWITAALEPPPTGADTEVSLRQVCSRQLGGGLRRRISWVERCDPPAASLPAVALYEYMADPQADSGAVVTLRAETAGSEQRPSAGTESERDSGPDSETGSESEADSESDRGGKRTMSEQYHNSVAAEPLKRQRLESDQ